MYYLLECDEDNMTAYISSDGKPIYVPIDGQVVDANKYSTPFLYKYHDHFGEPLFDFYSSGCLMSNRLVAAIEEAGCNNLQLFDAELRNEENDILNKEFCAVNIVGLVKCADVEASTTSKLGGGHYFHNLVIDINNVNNVNDLGIFRLAESLMDIIVNESVANSIKAKNLRGVQLIPLTINL